MFGINDTANNPGYRGNQTQKRRRQVASMYLCQVYLHIGLVSGAWACGVWSPWAGSWLLLLKAGARLALVQGKTMPWKTYAGDTWGTSLASSPAAATRRYSACGTSGCIRPAAAGTRRRGTCTWSRCCRRGSGRCRTRRHRACPTARRRRRSTRGW